MCQGAVANELRALLGEFRRLIVDHFQNEEDLMQHHAVSDAHHQLHSRTHQGYLNYIDSVDELFNLSPTAVIDHMLTLLSEWLSFHIISIDKRLAEEITALRAGVPPDQAMAEENTFEDTLINAMGGLYGILGKRTFELVEANCQLQESIEQIEGVKQEWESTFDSLPQLICLLDAEGHVFRTNHTLELWSLSKVVEVRGQLLHDLLHPECSDPDCALENFKLTPSGK